MTIGDDIKGVLKELEPKAWVKCPFCGKEWNKLHPCLYFRDGEEKKTHICIRCAEGVRAIPKLQVMIPIPGVEYELLLRKGYKNQPIAIEELPSAWWAVVSYTTMIFKLEPQSTGALKVTYSADMENPNFYENIFQAWMAIKTKFEKGDPIEGAPKWGGFGKEKRHNTKRKYRPFEPGDK